MQAFRILEPQKAELREVPVPEPGPRQVLIKVGGRAPAIPTCISLTRPRTRARQSSLHDRPRERGVGREAGAGRSGSRPETR
jgi:hypothetical protein